MLPRHCLLFVVLLYSFSANAQPLNVTFRYIESPGQDIIRAFLPGQFNNWGPNSNGCISSNAASLMAFDDALNQWTYTTTLQIGQSYEYKVHLHYTPSGSGCGSNWLSDPLNDVVTGTLNNSVITVTNPMLFQLARETNEDGKVYAVSAGLFGTQAITTLSFEINGEAQDGLSFYDATTGIFRTELTAPVPAGSQFKITATDAGGTTISEQVGVIPPTVEDAARPAGVEDGVTYWDNDPTIATLSLFAPGISFVHVIGDFNNWEIDDAYLMKRDATAGEDSVRWWLTIDGLNATQEYGYQYLIEGEQRIADFFSTKILDPNNDPFIPETTYPNLKPYPTGQTQGIVSVLQPGQDAYPWVITDFERPPASELVIYEMLLRDFLGTHDYNTLVDTLDYIDRLGVNAIELMPISEFGGNLNWGYQPTFYFAPDKYYGTANDLRRFVDEAHQRGIAVIMDVVYNHVDLPNPLLELFGLNSNNPFINVPALHPFNVFFDLNHENPYNQYWLDRVNRYWIEEFKIDGYRFDLSKGFTQTNSGGNVGLWSSYDASRVELLTRMADAIWAVDEDAYISFEHFGGFQEESELATYRRDEGRSGMLLWDNLNRAYNEATMGYSSNLNGVYFGPGGRNFPVPNLISLMESHDEQWLMYKNLTFGACERSPSGGSACNPNLDANFGTYNIRQLGVALDRQKLAGAFFFTIPGPKMMWQFGELGYGFGNNGEQCLKPGDGSNGDCPSFAPGRTGSKAIRWDYRDDPLREKLYKTWSALINLRMDYEVFHDTNTEVDLNTGGTIKQIRLTHPTMNVLIIGNFGVTPSEFISFDFQSEGLWYEFFSREVRDSAQDDAVSLLPGEFRVYTTQELPAPEEDLITVDTEDTVDVPLAYELASNYPNPFNPQTTIRFTLPETSPVKLTVFDALGREIVTLVEGTRFAGSHTVPFDGTGLPSGMYLYRLEAGGQVFTQQMLLIK